MVLFTRDLQEPLCTCFPGLLRSERRSDDFYFPGLGLPFFLAVASYDQLDNWFVGQLVNNDPDFDMAINHHKPAVDHRNQRVKKLLERY